MTAKKQVTIRVTTRNGRPLLWRHVVEKVLGHALPEPAVVHHVNENRRDNRNRNLVACENRAYHALLHRRLRALRACGNPNWQRCLYCKEYDNPENLAVRTRYNRNTSEHYHRHCNAAYEDQRRRSA